MTLELKKKKKKYYRLVSKRRFPRLYPCIAFIHSIVTPWQFYWYKIVFLVYEHNFMLLLFSSTPVRHKSLESKLISARTRCPCVAIAGNGRTVKRYYIPVRRRRPIRICNPSSNSWNFPTTSVFNSSNGLGKVGTVNVSRLSRIKTEQNNSLHVDTYVVFGKS